MKNKNLIAFACAATFAISACAATPASLPPGEYTRTQKSTNAQGTQVERTTNTNVYYDQDGKKRALQETETSKDPKGMFNKSTSKSTTAY